MKTIGQAFTSIFAIALIAGLPLAHAEDTGSLENGMNAIKNTGKSIGHATRDAAKDVKDSVTSGK